MLAGFERHCRIAVADIPLLLMRLPLLAEQTRETADYDEGAIA